MESTTGEPSESSRPVLTGSSSGEAGKPSLAACVELPSLSFGAMSGENSSLAPSAFKSPAGGKR